MKTNIYSIYDTVAEVFNKPFQDINNATAIRNFSASVINEAHKNDYVLYRLAEFDDLTGDIIKAINPEKVLTGFDVIQQTTQDPAILTEQAC